eukprot:1410223-Prymnesium_polylepis.1
MRRRLRRAVVCELATLWNLFEWWKPRVESLCDGVCDRGVCVWECDRELHLRLVALELVEDLAARVLLVRVLNAIDDNLATFAVVTFGMLARHGLPRPAADAAPGGFT